MTHLTTKRGDLPRTHRDRHPGILDNIDQPHPLERKPADARRTVRGAGRGPSREGSPR
jgi:hypothetical protein